MSVSFYPFYSLPLKHPNKRIEEYSKIILFILFHFILSQQMRSQKKKRKKGKKEEVSILQLIWPNENDKFNKRTANTRVKKKFNATRKIYKGNFLKRPQKPFPFLQKDQKKRDYRHGIFFPLPIYIYIYIYILRIMVVPNYAKIIKHPAGENKIDEKS